MLSHKYEHFICRLKCQNKAITLPTSTDIQSTLIYVIEINNIIMFCVIMLICNVYRLRKNCTASHFHIDVEDPISFML